MQILIAIAITALILISMRHEKRKAHLRRRMPAERRAELLRGFERGWYSDRGTYRDL